VLQRLLLLFVAAGATVAQEPPPDPVFHAGTRLVEVDVVVRHKPVRPPGFRAGLRYILDTGPPFGPAGALARGLTKEDFSILDNGKPQSIAVFGVGPSTGNGKAASLPAGAVSNRTDSMGRPVNGATAILVDLLNTPFEYTDYARTGLKNLIRSLSRADSAIALYSLGERLHVLHDFADDSRDLEDAASALDQPHGRLPPEYARALRDFGDIMALEGGEDVAADIHGRITFGAVTRIIQHLSGMPGRKSLIWLSEMAQLPPRLMAMLQRANIVLYPVMVRCFPAPCGFAAPESGYAKTTEIGLTFGGRGFYDASDLFFAFRAAQEDADTAYVLGYYPDEALLDGKYHRIAVSLNQAKIDPATSEVHYRSGYLATRVELPPPPPALAELVDNPLDSSGIGLAAQATSESENPRLYDVRLTIDLHDIRLDHKDGRSTGSFYVSFPDPSVKGNARTGLIAIDLTDSQLADKLKTGYSLFAQGVESDAGEIRMVVRDRATGVAGSLRVRVDKR
jgi:VWFA-related protein